MLFTTDQFTITITLFVFLIFFLVGYLSEKKSGGFFLIFAGFLFIYFSLIASSLFTSLVSVFIAPFGIFLILIGIKKAFYHVEEKGNVRQGG